MSKNRYVIIIGACLGIVLLVQTGIAILELLDSLGRWRAFSVLHFPRIRGLMDDHSALIDWKISESLQKVTNMSFPHYLKEHALYDSSSKQALLALRANLRAKQVTLPLFRNMLDENTPSTPPKICLSVATARRKGSPFLYLVQSVSALLNRMNYVKFQKDVYIHVFNVDSEPEKHKEIELIRDLVPVTNLKVPIPPNGDFPIQPHYHENMDTAHIIRELHRIGCEYPILIEDDALATTNWVESVMHMIDDLDAGTRAGVNWFAVRLFVARSSYPRLRRPGVNYYDPLFNMVAVLLNRNHMLPFAAAMEEKVNVTMQAKNHELHLPKDLVMDQYKTAHGLKVLAYEPVIFQHTGVFSSVSNRTVDRSSVTNWIMFSKYFDAAGEPILFQDSYW